MEEARNIYRRACEIHLPYKHSFHLQWAMFEERHGEEHHEGKVNVTSYLCWLSDNTFLTRIKCEQDCLCSYHFCTDEMLVKPACVSTDLRSKT